MIKKFKYLSQETSKSWANDQSYTPCCTNLELNRLLIQTQQGFKRTQDYAQV